MDQAHHLSSTPARPAHLPQATLSHSLAIAAGHHQRRKSGSSASALSLMLGTSHSPIRAPTTTTHRNSIKSDYSTREYVAPILLHFDRMFDRLEKWFSVCVPHPNFVVACFFVSMSVAVVVAGSVEYRAPSSSGISFCWWSIFKWRCQGQGGTVL